MKKNELIIAHSLHIDIAKEIANIIIERQSLGDDANAQQQHPITVGELKLLIESQKPPTLNPSTLSRHIISAFNNKKNAYYKDLNRERTLIRIVAADGSLFAYNICSNLEQSGISPTDKAIDDCVQLTLANLQNALNQCYKETLEITSRYLGCEIQFETWDNFKQHTIHPKERHTTDFSYAGSKNLWSEGVLPLIKIVKDSRDHEAHHVNTYDFLLRSMQQLHRKALLKQQQQKEADSKTKSALVTTHPAQIRSRQSDSTSLDSPTLPTQETRLPAKEQRNETKSALPHRGTNPSQPHKPKLDTEQKSQRKSGAAPLTSSSRQTMQVSSLPPKNKRRGPHPRQSASKPSGYDVFIDRSLLLDNLHLFTDHTIDSMFEKLRALLDLPSDSSADHEFQANSTILRRFIESVYDNRKPLRFTIIELNAVEIRNPNDPRPLSSPLDPRDQIIVKLKEDFSSILGSCHRSTVNSCVQTVLNMLPSPEVETQIGRVIRACYISTKSYSHRQEKSRTKGRPFNSDTCLKWAMGYIAHEVNLYSSYFRLHSNREITYRPLANNVSSKLSPHDYAVVSTIQSWRNREYNILNALSHLVCSPHFNIDTGQIQKGYSSPVFKGNSHALNRFTEFLLQDKNITSFFDKTINEWVETIFFNNTIIYSTPNALSLWTNILDNLYRACDEKSSSNGKLFLSLQAALFFSLTPQDTKTGCPAEEKSPQESSGSSASRPLLTERSRLSLNEEQAKFTFFVSMGINPYNYIKPHLPLRPPTNSTNIPRTDVPRRRPRSQPTLRQPTHLFKTQYPHPVAAVTLIAPLPAKPTSPPIKP